MIDYDPMWNPWRPEGLRQKQGPRYPVHTDLDAGIDPERFREWAWLLPRPMRPLLVNCFGDAFFRDGRDGSLHFLDVLVGDLHPVAADADRLVHMLTDSGFREVFLRTDLLARLAARGLILGDGELFRPKRPLSMGGTLEPDNFEISPLVGQSNGAGALDNKF